MLGHRQTDRQTGYPHNKFFFHFVKNAKVYELHFKDITVLLVMYMFLVYENLHYISLKNCRYSELQHITTDQYRPQCHHVGSRTTIWNGVFIHCRTTYFLVRATPSSQDGQICNMTQVTTLTWIKNRDAMNGTITTFSIVFQTNNVCDCTPHIFCSDVTSGNMVESRHQ